MQYPIKDYLQTQREKNVTFRRKTLEVKSHSNRNLGMKLIIQGTIGKFHMMLFK